MMGSLETELQSPFRQVGNRKSPVQPLPAHPYNEAVRFKNGRGVLLDSCNFRINEVVTDLLAAPHAQRHKPIAISPRSQDQAAELVRVDNFGAIPMIKPIGNPVQGPGRETKHTEVILLPNHDFTGKLLWSNPAMYQEFAAVMQNDPAGRKVKRAAGRLVAQVKTRLDLLSRGFDAMVPQNTQKDFLLKNQRVIL